MVSLLATALVVLVWVTRPFAHGIWLAAYLFLVGFLAQLLLVHGQGLLQTGASTPEPRRCTQLLLWNLGVLAVPLGVLGGARLAVLVGSVSLLGALLSLWGSTRGARTDAAGQVWVRRAYRALIGFMAISTVAGLALAWSIPWL